MLIALFELSAIEKIVAQANTSLSNLVAPTAVNVDLIPFSTNLRSFGSSGHNWNNMFFIGNVYKGSKVFITSLYKINRVIKYKYSNTIK